MWNETSDNGDQGIMNLFWGCDDCSVLLLFSEVRAQQLNRANGQLIAESLNHWFDGRMCPGRQGRVEEVLVEEVLVGRCWSKRCVCCSKQASSSSSKQERASITKSTLAPWVAVAAGFWANGQESQMLKCPLSCRADTGRDRWFLQALSSGVPTALKQGSNGRVS